MNAPREHYQPGQNKIPLKNLIYVENPVVKELRSTKIPFLLCSNAAFLIVYIILHMQMLKDLCTKVKAESINGCHRIRNI